MSRRVNVLCVLAATVVVLVLAHPAAASVDALSALGGGMLNHLTDGSDDILVPGTGYTGYDPTTQTYSGFGSGTIVGPNSILLSAFNINEIANRANPTGTLLPQPPYTQLAGLSLIQVSNVSQSTDANSPTGYSYNYQFGAVSQTVANLAAISAVSPNAAAALATWTKNTTMLGVYDGGQPVFNNSSYVDATVGQVTNSANLTWQFGLNGAYGTGWKAIGLPTNDIALLGVLAPNYNTGSVNFSLDQTANTGWSNLLATQVPSNVTGLGPPALVDVSANTSFSTYTGTPVTPVPAGQYVWEVSDLTSATVYAVPEPASLFVWLGACLVGGVLLRRRLRRS